MIDERHLNGTTGESKSYTVINNVNATSTARNLYYEQLQEQSDRDYVEVVRCKDCVHNQLPPTSGNADCELWYGMTDVNGYCHYGERREDAKTD